MRRTFHRVPGDRQDGTSRRRAMVLGLGAAASLVARPTWAEQSGPAVGAIRVDIEADPTPALRNVAPMVAEAFAEALGGRYQPGRSGGATLVIGLRFTILDDDDSGSGSVNPPRGHDNGID